ncbi:MAG: ABC transporter substrate-binding protein, partial [Anaerolineales bacterium]|nr:ABC transporter substrate-binding protein [Anaerolineales bacterium]
ERTVQIRLSKPIPNMEGHLLYHYILPQHIWGRYENSLDTYDNLEMIGSGPFKVAVYAQDSFIHLQKVADHYLFSPKIEDIVFLAYPDESTLKEGILSGDVSLILNLPYFEVESLAEDPTIEVVTGLPLYPEFEEIVFNQLAPEDCPPFEEDSSFVLPDDLTLQPCSGHPALRDHTVRLALSHAVDKTTLLDQVLRGRGASGLSVIPPGLQDYFDPTLQDYPYDPQQAKDLLDQAGYLDTDGDGVREMPATSEEPGRPLSFRLYYLGPDLLFELLLEHLTPMWQEIGIELNIRALDADTIIYLCCPTYDYDMILWGWGVEPEPGNFFNIFDTASIATGGNESGFSDPDYDILNAVQHTETDPAQRLKLITQLQTIIHTEAVNLVFFYPDAVAAYRPDHFTGWNLDAPHLALDNIHSLITLEPATP